MNDFKNSETPVIKPDYIITSLPVSAHSVFCIALLTSHHVLGFCVHWVSRLPQQGYVRVHQGQLHVNVSQLTRKDDQAAAVVESEINF